MKYKHKHKLNQSIPTGKHASDGIMKFYYNQCRRRKQRTAFVCYITSFLIFFMLISHILIIELRNHFYYTAYMERQKDDTTSLKFEDTTTTRKDKYDTASFVTNSSLLGVYTIPNEPDLSIGKMLRSIIPFNHSSPLSTCSPTSQIRIKVFQHHGNEGTEESKNMVLNGKGVKVRKDRGEEIRRRRDEGGRGIGTTTWLLEALDEQGNKKTVGGDEFFIKYKDKTASYSNSSAIAIVVDNQDGTYTLEFVSIPKVPFIKEAMTGPGSLTVHFIYTCGIGRMTRPFKDNWKNGANLLNQHTLPNIIKPPIRNFYEPNTLSNGSRIVDLSQFDRIYCFGDSQLQNMCGFFGKYKRRIYPLQNNIKPSKNVGKYVRSHNLESAFVKLKELHGTHLLNYRKKQALILNSAAWEIAENTGPIPGHYFDSSLLMYREYIQGVRNLFPNVTLLWKSVQPFHLSALHISCFRNVDCFNRTRYISNSIAKYLYDEQERIMNELGVPILDVWEATDAAEIWNMNHDALHYTDDFNDYLQKQFYPKRDFDVDDDDDDDDDDNDDDNDDDYHDH